MNKDSLILKCNELILAYQRGDLGQTIMPEDQNPGFSDSQKEERLAYFSLPMALNYQRNSYDLWKAALKTYSDPETKAVFDVNITSKMSDEQLRTYLLKYKLALQPNKHIDTWKKIAATISNEFGTFTNLLEATENDFLRLKQTVQVDYKKGFPYLSGVKIFNYWSFILNSYCNADLQNSDFIDIAPDTHITKCSVILGVISEKEAGFLTRDEISEKWRAVLRGSGINPIDMHPPLWFWSRNGFIYQLQND